MFVDWGTNSNAFKAEIYFVGAREFPSCRFGGRMDEVQDPQTGLIVTLRAFGEYALRVVDPTKLIFNLVGTVDVTNNEAITGWVAQQLLKVTRTTVTTQLMSGAWPILGLSMHSPDIEAAAMPASNEQLAAYGLVITRFGNLDVNLDDDDNARLKKLAGDTAYSRLAGGFLQAAQAEALQGAGEGMAQGGAAVTPMFLGAGFGMANQMMQPPAQAAPPPPPGPGFAGGGQGFTAPPPAPAPAPAPQDAAPPGATMECGNCHSHVRAGAKFCDSCGTPMQKHCTNCNADLSATAKFCAECGTPASPPSV
jgi:membrane protease subunit (stomatin/prohibitin family)